jgi:hypothetical protein
VQIPSATKGRLPHYQAVEGAARLTVLRHTTIDHGALHVLRSLLVYVDAETRPAGLVRVGAGLADKFNSTLIGVSAFGVNPPFVAEGMVIDDKLTQAGIKELETMGRVVPDDRRYCAAQGGMASAGGLAERAVGTRGGQRGPDLDRAGGRRATCTARWMPPAPS